jgi:nascent polypeptide-associated complex subunit alpha
MDPRQMAMMMKRMGIQMDELEGVQEVLVRTTARDYRFRKASVTVMKAQGSETWQVQGKPEVIEKGAPLANQPQASVPTPANVAAPAPIPEEDVRLVMEQAKVDAKTARKALEEAGGDLAEALVKLGR